MQNVFAFVLKMYHYKCNRDCNRDYFQYNRLRDFVYSLIVIEQVASNRNRLHFCCNHPMSDVITYFNRDLTVSVLLVIYSLYSCRYNVKNRCPSVRIS